MIQTSVGDLGTPKVQYFESSQSIEVFQSSIGDLRRVVEVKPLEVCQSLEVFQSGVGELPTDEYQARNVRQFREIFYRSVVVDFDDIGMSKEIVSEQRS